MSLRIDDTQIGPTPFRLVDDSTGAVLAAFSTRQLAENDPRYRMSTQLHPLSEWEQIASDLIKGMRVMLKGMGEVNDVFAANGVQEAIVTSLTNDPTGAGLLPGTGLTANHAIMWMALMADVEAFVAGQLTEIQGLPVPLLTRRLAIQRRPEPLPTE